MAIEKKQNSGRSVINVKIGTLSFYNLRTIKIPEGKKF